MPTLPLDIRVEYGIDVSAPNTAINLGFTRANNEIGVMVAGFFNQTINIGSLDIPTNTFPSVDDAIVYYMPAISAAMVANVNTAAAGTGNTYVFRDWYKFVETGSKEIVDKVLSTLPILSAPGAHINDAATNAATNAPTNLNVLTTLLGTLTGEVNATNQKQNDLATKFNDLGGKFNTLLDRLEAKTILAT